MGLRTVIGDVRRQQPGVAAALLGRKVKAAVAYAVPSGLMPTARAVFAVRIQTGENSAVDGGEAGVFNRAGHFLPQAVFEAGRAGHFRDPGHGGLAGCLRRAEAGEVVDVIGQVTARRRLGEEDDSGDRVAASAADDHLHVLAARKSMASAASRPSSGCC